jgi:TolA-binding protein
MAATTEPLVLAFAAVLLVAPMAAAAPAAGVGLSSQATESPTTDGVAPGEKLSGVVSVQQAELEGEVDERTYGLRVAQANASGAKADVVADQLEDVEQRIDELEQQKQTLQEARENGSMSEGEYRARMSTVAAELSTARRLANASEATASGLPEAVLAEKGIDVAAIRALQERAANLSGPEVAEIAKSIAGGEVGRSMAGAQKPSDVGKQGPDDARNGTDGGPGDQGGGPPDGTDADSPNGSDGDAP